MSRLFDVVVAYEAAFAADREAGEAWKVARDKAEEELVRVYPEYKGGSFAFADDDLTDDQLYWVAADSDWPGVPMTQAPAEVARAARIYGVAEALVAERRASAAWSMAGQRLLSTPCADERDLLEKFRALGVDDNFFVASKVYESAMAEIRRIVDEVSELGPTPTQAPLDELVLVPELFANRAPPN